MGYALQSLDGRRHTCALAAVSLIVAALLFAAFADQGPAGAQTTPTVWNQLGADLNGQAPSNFFGNATSISADGNRLIVGATLTNGSRAGRIRMFEWDGTSWNQLGAAIDGEANDDFLGAAVSISDDGTTVAAGTDDLDGSGGSRIGYAKIFRWDGTTWNQLGNNIVGQATGDTQEGVGLSADGNTVVVGAIGNDGGGDNAGNARVFRWDGTTWNQLGADIQGENVRDRFGWSVAISDLGDTIIAGAPDADPTAASAGLASIYRWDGTTWNQLGNNLEGEALTDSFGRSVAISSDGDTVVVGAPFADGATGTNSGDVRAYRWDGTTWNQLGNDIDGASSSDFAGSSVSMAGDGNTIILGASLGGYARVYDWDGTSWNQVGADVTENVAVSISADGNTIASSLDRDNNDTGLVRVHRRASPLFCNGSVVTVNIGLGQVPTTGPDVILGTSGADTIDGLAGEDTICGLSGDDIIMGGVGIDTILGGGGNDTILGGGGADIISGQGGDDIINGENAADLIMGGVGNDTITGGPGNDDIRGQAGNDVMNGNEGVDQFFGGSGNDTIHADIGGNAGTIQVVNGQSGGDTIFGSPQADVLNGGPGQDEIHGGNGNDILRGGRAADDLFGDNGDDTLEGGPDRDALSGGNGTDDCNGGGATNDTADATCETTTLIP